MALVVFLRGVNVGGHNTFRPSVLARDLAEFDIVNIGAAGTFVVHRPGPQARFRAALVEQLPFDMSVALCEGRDVLRLEHDNPFEPGPAPEGVTRFVSILAKRTAPSPPLPLALPAEGDWLVRLVAARDRFVFGEYRRHMRTIGYLGRADKLFGGQATTRSWNTILKVVRVLEGQSSSTGSPSR